ncbi:hypothetical protein [Ruminococcus sp.]|uniref:hypothetical protein n=1 Tax=Ruminococcus sp. TaxID=41978 RepID=UPI0025F6B121|nr:hypothetical protein [Ruminococcus sp.]MCR4638966.1 hypothetical protein [Ruminococcus sp.]
MEIVYVKDGRYDEYENLLMERDRYRKEAQAIFRQYIHEFGEQITAVFKQKISCIEKKKMLSYCMMYFNRGESVDMTEVQKLIKHDMAEYQSQLNDMIANNEACKDMKTIPESEVLKIRQIYRRIAKKLHPDLNPLTEQHEELMDLWLRNLTAYQCNDLKEIEEVEFLVDQALAALGEGKTTVTIPDIDDKIENLYKEIEKIKSTDPYLYRDILSDDSLIKEKKQALENELNEYIEYAEQLDQQLKQFIVEGGTFTWTS